MSRSSGTASRRSKGASTSSVTRSAALRPPKPPPRRPPRMRPPPHSAPTMRIAARTRCSRSRCRSRQVGRGERPDRDRDPARLFQRAQDELEVERPEQSERARNLERTEAVAPQTVEVGVYLEIDVVLVAPPLGGLVQD